jgi:peroxiredoxin family protein
MAEKEKMTLVVFSGELDKALAAFNIAVTGAASGMEVTMFFTFWGLNIIRKDKAKSKPPGVMRRMLGMLNKGGAKRSRLSKFHMGGMGTWMMKKLMRQSKMPSLQEMITMANEMGVKFVACTTTIALQGLTEEDFIPEVKSFAGASSYLGEAREGKVNLFI